MQVPGDMNDETQAVWKKKRPDETENLIGYYRKQEKWFASKKAILV